MIDEDDEEMGARIGFWIWLAILLERRFRRRIVRIPIALDLRIAHHHPHKT